MDPRFAASIGLPLMLSLPSGGEWVEAKDRFIRQRGFRHVGGSFHWTLPGHGVAGAW